MAARPVSVNFEMVMNRYEDNPSYSWSSFLRLRTWETRKKVIDSMARTAVVMMRMRISILSITTLFSGFNR